MDSAWQTVDPARWESSPEAFIAEAYGIKRERVQRPESLLNLCFSNRVELFPITIDQQGEVSMSHTRGIGSSLSRRKVQLDKYSPVTPYFGSDSVGDCESFKAILAEKVLVLSPSSFEGFP